jgi:cell division protein FtsB
MHAKVEPARLKKHTVPLDEHRPLRLADVTHSDGSDEQMFRQRRGRLVLAAFATTIVLAIGAALFVLPIKSWLRQRDSLATRTGELATLNAANNQLQTEVDRLQTDDGVKQAAREVIDYVEKGEQRITVMPMGPAPTSLPAGWPYDLVTSIVALRESQATGAVAAAPQSTATTVAPVVPAVPVIPAGSTAPTP